MEEHTTLSDSNLDGAGWALTFPWPVFLSFGYGLVTIINQETGPFSSAFFQNVRNFPDVIVDSMGNDNYKQGSDFFMTFSGKKEKSILDFPTKSLQNTLTVSINKIIFLG